MQSNSSPAPKRARSQGGIVYDEEPGSYRSHKGLTKPQDPPDGVIGGLVSISSGVAPQIRGYERTSTTNHWLVGHPENIN
jgi:hypothetical protein